jgi:hypothetical protein
LVRKSERKTSLGRSRCKWKDNIKMTLKKEISWRTWTTVEGREKWQAVMTMEMNLWVP